MIPSQSSLGLWQAPCLSLASSEFWLYAWAWEGAGQSTLPEVRSGPLHTFLVL